MRHLTLLAIFAIVLAACAPQPGTPPGAASPTANPNAVADFYRGKTVTVIVGYTASGAYNQYARLLANHIGKHIPGNPTIIVQNMDGAGSMLAANALFTTQPKDGTAFGTFGRGLPANELLGQPEAKFKSTEFNWLGSLNDEVSVCVVRADSPIKKFEDLYTTSVKIGATGPDDDTGFFPRFLNGAMGTKFQLITGYPGGGDINLAVERGEVAGRCGLSWSSLVATKPNWLKDKFVTVLTQMALAKHPDISADVPLIIDLAKDTDTKTLFEVVFSRQTMGRPFAAPPGVPADRVAALRKAFLDTTKDPEFIADAQKQALELRPKSGEEVQALVAKIFQTPQSLRDKLNAVLKQ